MVDTYKNKDDDIHIQYYRTDDVWYLILLKQEVCAITIDDRQALKLIEKLNMEKVE